MADKKPEEFFVGSGPKPTKWQSVKTFIWNSETSEFMGRTGVNWGKIIFIFKICSFANLKKMIFFMFKPRLINNNNCAYSIITAIKRNKLLLKVG